MRDPSGEGQADVLCKVLNKATLLLEICYRVAYFTETRQTRLPNMNSKNDIDQMKSTRFLFHVIDQ